MHSKDPVNATTFRAAMATVPTSVTVISVRDRSGGDQGITVGTLASLSLDPPLVIVCIANDAAIAGAMRQATTFGASILADDQEALSIRFAHHAQLGFGDLRYVRGPSGTALLDGAVTHLECAIVARHPGGDHTIVVGEVRYTVHSDREPLLHHRSTYRRTAP